MCVTSIIQLTGKIKAVQALQDEWFVILMRSSSKICKTKYSDQYACRTLILTATSFPLLLVSVAAVPQSNSSTAENK